MICWDRLLPGDQWDQNMLERLFAGKLYPHGLDIQQCQEGDVSLEGGIILIPGRYFNDDAGYAVISDLLSARRWVLAIRTSDEKDTFDISRVDHPNIAWWVQTPRTDRDYGDPFLFGVGFPPHFNDLSAYWREKVTPSVFLSAQNNHIRRHECFGAFQEGRKKTNWWVNPTDGFTQGLHPSNYVSMMMDAKVAPAPSGVFTPDSFRVYEALEAHTIPIADTISPDPDYDSNGYWYKIFPDCPFPVLQDYASLPDYIDKELADWPANANRITAWWMGYKRQMSRRLRRDLQELGAPL